MSGFVALFQRNGAPVNRALLNGLTSFLDFRGPDARQTWVSGPIGLGHTLLRTTRASANERQPVSLDGQSWIAADVRLDRRVELRDRLIGAGQDVDRTANDAELVLHAFMAWKDDCVAHLYGDFAFAIWDARQRRLFCARDHFGIKPFYYAVTQDFFLCSNTLDCVRLHPAVSDELNDDAIADFLLFGLNCNKATTTFKDVQRLQPAHTLSIRETDLQTRRYWSPPVDGRIRYKRHEEYVEHFRENLRLAVADRLDVDRAAIFLSGGMDSGSVAATAREVAPATNLRAFTVTCEHLIGDREGYFAKQTADFLGIPIQFLPIDHIKPFEYGENDDLPSPEPVDDSLVAGGREQFAAVAKHSRVALDGEGSDNLMHFQLAPYTKYLFGRGEWLTLASAISGYLWTKRARWYRIGFRAWRRVRQTGHSNTCPTWITRDFARRTNAEERWRNFGPPIASPSHPVHPDGHASFDLPHWARMFEGSDSESTKKLVEVRFPYLDLRMVEYLLALPPYPFFLNKKIERDAMKGTLPESILSRPKTPFAGDPAAMATAEKRWDHWDWKGEIARYIDREALLRRDGPYPAHGTSCIRAVCLNFWLRGVRKFRYNCMVEIAHG